MQSGASGFAGVPGDDIIGDEIQADAVQRPSRFTCGKTHEKQN